MLLYFLCCYIYTQINSASLIHLPSKSFGYHILTQACMYAFNKPIAFVPVKAFHFFKNDS